MAAAVSATIGSLLAALGLSRLAPSIPCGPALKACCSGWYNAAPTQVSHLSQTSAANNMHCGYTHGLQSCYAHLHPDVLLNPSWAVKQPDIVPLMHGH